MKSNLLFRIIPGWILMIVAFLYIHKMKGCECTDKNVVDKLHTIELFFMGLSAFLLTSMSIFHVNLKSYLTPFIKTGVTKYMPLFSAFFAAWLSLYAYFVYLVYEFYLGVSGCKCADDPMKYALYVQGGLYSTSLAICAIIVVWFGYSAIKNR